MRGAGGRQAVLVLAAALHLDTVAEGVEHSEQAEALATLACQLAQGHHFSRPSPPRAWARLTGRQRLAAIHIPSTRTTGSLVACSAHGSDPHRG